MVPRRTGPSQPGPADSTDPDERPAARPSPAAFDVGEWLCALGAAVALGAFLVLLHQLALRRLVHFPLFTHRHFADFTGLLVGAAVASGLRPLARWRPWILLSASVAVMTIALGTSALVVGVYALTVCGLARLPTRTSVRLAAALLLWGSWFLLRSYLPRPGAMFIVLWAQLAYSAIYLIVEHTRGKATGSLGADLFYLLAFPRLLVPFFQPVSPAYLWAQSRRVPDLKLIVRAVLLGLWGVGGAVFVRVYGPKIGALGFLERWSLSLLVFYGHVSSVIFIAVALFRLVGFDIHSGYRTPWLSSSFAEFFRRYNYYVRDAVVTLFYLPLTGWLRRRVPKVVTRILAAYLAIIIGSFLLNDILVPAAMSGSLRTAASWIEPRRLFVLVVFWTAIILPRAGLIAVKKPTGATSPLRRVMRVVVFNLMWFTMWVLGSHAVWRQL